MKLIDASRAYDGQGALLNGIHDGVRIPREPCLYRKGYPWARLNRALWRVGHALGRLPLMGRIVSTDSQPRNTRRIHHQTRAA